MPSTSGTQNAQAVNESRDSTSSRKYQVLVDHMPRKRYRALYGYEMDTRKFGTGVSLTWVPEPSISFMRHYPDLNHVAAYLNVPPADVKASWITGEPLSTTVPPPSMTWKDSGKSCRRRAGIAIHSLLIDDVRRVNSRCPRWVRVVQGPSSDSAITAPPAIKHPQYPHIYALRTKASAGDYLGSAVPTDTQETSVVSHCKLFKGSKHIPRDLGTILIGLNPDVLADADPTMIPIATVKVKKSLWGDDEE